MNQRQTVFSQILQFLSYDDFRSCVRRYLHGKLTRLKDPRAFDDYLQCARKTDWVVYSKLPFGGPAQVLDYLGRYTHRVAISHNRLVALRDGKIAFRWKDYSQGNRIRLMTLDAGEFIRRFLLLVLPSRFMRLRHYGLLSNRDRNRKLARCRVLLPQSDPLRLSRRNLQTGSRGTRR
jgi:Putative transposase